MFIVITDETKRAVALAATKELAELSQVEWSCTAKTSIIHIPDEVLQSALLDQQRANWARSH